MLFVPVEDARGEVQLFVQQPDERSTYEAVRAQIGDEPGEARIFFGSGPGLQPYEAVMCDRVEVPDLIYITVIIDFEHREPAAEAPDIPETGIAGRTGTAYHEDPAFAAGEHARDGGLAPGEAALDVRG
jgi:hypothetical protein